MRIENIMGVRDYNSYARQLEENTNQKFAETVEFVLLGRVGDIGCATGAWLKSVASERSFRNCHLFGVEVADPLYRVSSQRRRAGEFGGVQLSLLRGDALDGPFFSPDSMDTIHTSSVTHEIYSHTSESHVQSYGNDDAAASVAAAHSTIGEKQLKEFIAHRYEELRPNGVWINRDVVGPEHGDRLVELDLCETDGNAPSGATVDSKEKTILGNLSTLERFQRFAYDYRRVEGYRLSYLLENTNHGTRVRLPLRDAWEFATKKDYIDNWEAEMHESFCFWSFSNWVHALEEGGFEVLEGSRAFTNPWIVERRLQKSIKLSPVGDFIGNVLPFPPTNMVIVARKRASRFR
jgi:hypothetical protein